MEGSWGAFGASLVPKPKNEVSYRFLGVLLGPSWGRLGAVLGLSWAVLGRSGFFFGPLWVRIGAVFGWLGAVFVGLRAVGGAQGSKEHCKTKYFVAFRLQKPGKTEYVIVFVCSCCSCCILLSSQVPNVPQQFPTLARFPFPCQPRFNRFAHSAGPF